MEKLNTRLILVAYSLLAIFSAFYFEGVGDTGDSVMHYLYAKYAPVHPELYFNHWAKPLFVMLASPMAQFGFVGVKLFNVLCLILTIHFSQLVGKELGLKRPWLIGVFIFFAPLNFILTFSGLTEPLFACWLAIFLYFQVVKQRNYTAAIWLSFLPFVRSEGLVIIGVVGLYYLFTKRYKSLPWLATGHIVFGLAGSWFHGSVFWVLNKIPYANLNGAYGSGTWWHFIDQLFYVVGLPIYVLLLLGCVSVLVNKTYRKKSEMLFLILGVFVAFLVAHSAFWYLGIFNSMGLKRVMISVMPVMAILTLIGLNTIVDNRFLKTKIANGVAYGFAVLIICFPFLGTPSSIHWRRDMMKCDVQKVAEQTAAYANQAGLAPKMVCFASPYLAETLKLDYFDTSKHCEPSPENLAKLSSQDIVIWDSWFSPVEFAISPERLRDEFGMELLKEFTAGEENEVKYMIWVKKD